MNNFEKGKERTLIKQLLVNTEDGPALKEHGSHSGSSHQPFAQFSGPVLFFLPHPIPINKKTCCLQLNGHSQNMTLAVLSGVMVGGRGTC